MDEAFTPIYNQADLHTLPFGRFGSHYNGCGWIAVYNLLLLMGRPIPSESVRTALAPMLRFGGRLGLFPFALGGYLQNMGIVGRWHLGVGSNAGAGICFFWRKNLTAHYVAYVPTKTGVRIYNHGCSVCRDAPLDTTLEAYLKNEGAMLRLFWQQRDPIREESPLEYRLHTPLQPEDLAPLRIGDRVLLSGQIYTARDAAHARFQDALTHGQPLPLELSTSVIYYAGPSPTPPGMIVGAIGPTTAGRMDAYTPALLERGLLAMIGKGRRSPQVKAAMQKHGAVYFGFLGGAAALAAQHVSAVVPVAYADLGPEAVQQLTVTDFPLVVLADSTGDDLYDANT